MDYWTCSVCYLIYYIPDEECVVWNIGHSAFAISYIYAIHLTKGVLYGILDMQCLLSYMLYTPRRVYCMEYWTRGVCYLIYYTPDEGCVVWNIGHAMFAILYYTPDECCMEYWTRGVCYLIYYTPDDACVV